MKKQVQGFGATLISMKDTLKHLAYAQNAVADTINERYRHLNFELLMHAAMYSNVNPREFMNVRTARTVGDKFLIINRAWVSGLNRDKISRLIGENIICFTIDKGDSYFDDLREYVRADILQSNFKRTVFVENEDADDMYLISLPKNKTFTTEQIQLTQQIFNDPVIRE